MKVEREWEEEGRRKGLGSPKRSGIKKKNKENERLKVERDREEEGRRKEEEG